jgi:RecB family exonuclease
VAHRAVEALLSGVATQAELAERGAAVDASVEHVLAAEFGAARRALGALFALEHERLAAALHALLAEDARRAPFAVAAVEQAQEVRIERWTMRLRLDRVDRLADGSLAVIDYKTGARPSLGRWTAARLDDAQVPLYVATAREPVSAAVIAQLRGRGARYFGYWQDDAFPGKPSRLPAGRSWSEQVEDWRRQIALLATELAAGDVRFFVDQPKSLEELRGDYAPLTRVAEQLALERGALEPW